MIVFLKQNSNEASLKQRTDRLKQMVLSMTEQYDAHMILALEQAQMALQQGEFPVGCVIALNDRVVALGTRKGTSGQPTVFSEIDHAEIMALKALEKSGHGLEPARLTLFSTMEPCLMCLGAIIISGIRTIVYAYEDPMGGASNCDLGQLTPLYGSADIQIIPGVRRQESLDLFVQFFKKEDNLYWKNSYLEQYTLAQHNVSMGKNTK